MFSKYFSIALLITTLVHANNCNVNSTCCAMSQESVESADAMACPCNKPPTKDASATQECPCNKPPKKEIESPTLTAIRANATIDAFYLALTEQEQHDFSALVDALVAACATYDTIEAMTNDKEKVLDTMKATVSLTDIVYKVQEQNVWDVLVTDLFNAAKNA